MDKLLTNPLALPIVGGAYTLKQAIENGFYPDLFPELRTINGYDGKGGFYNWGHLQPKQVHLGDGEDRNPKPPKRPRPNDVPFPPGKIPKIPVKDEPEDPVFPPLPPWGPWKGHGRKRLTRFSKSRSSWYTKKGKLPTKDIWIIRAKKPGSKNKSFYY